MYKLLYNISGGMNMSVLKAIRLNEEVFKKLKSLAASKGLTIGDMVKLLIEHFEKTSK